jgi:hypothetical protein
MRCWQIVVIAAVACTPLAFAQESTARLLGTVTDPTGAVIPAANIVAHNVATGLERKAIADESGDCSIPLLPIGRYIVTAESSGFKTSTVTGLRVNQVFNLTNTASFASPGTPENLPTGGHVTSTRNQPRLFEFGLKFAF